MFSESVCMNAYGATEPNSSGCPHNYQSCISPVKQPTNRATDLCRTLEIPKNRGYASRLAYCTCGHFGMEIVHG